MLVFFRGEYLLCVWGFKAHSLEQTHGVGDGVSRDGLAGFHLGGPAAGLEGQGWGEVEGQQTQASRSATCGTLLSRRVPFLAQFGPAI